MGYHQAGFDVVGVDLKAQPRYPFEHVVSDAVQLLRDLLDGVEVVGHKLSDFDAIHASPPCQAYSITRHAYDSEGKHPDLVDVTRDLLIESGLPYVIENVAGAPLRDPLQLCGTEFDLQADDVDGVRLALRRHRLFESNVPLEGNGGCRHDGTTVAGVYSGSYHTKPEHRDSPDRRGGYTPRAAGVAEALLGIDWMNKVGMEQSIPPSYAKHIGIQLIDHIRGTDK